MSGPSLNEQSEKWLVGALLADPKLIGQARELEPLALNRDDLRTIFRAMLAIDSEGKPLDLVSVAVRLEEDGTLGEVGGPLVLKSLADDAPYVVHVGEWCEKIRDTAERRGLVREALAVTRMGDDAGISTETLRERLRTANNDGALARGGWADPTPLPDDLPDVMPFDDELLPSTFRPWIKDIAERLQCPPDFPAVAAMIPLGVIVGRKVGIRPKRQDDWLVVPNLWGAVIGRPSVMKSPAIREPLKVLGRLEVEGRDNFQAAQLDYEARLAVHAARKTALGRKVSKGEGDDAVESMAAFLAEAPEQPVRKRYMTNDATVPKLGEILSQNPNGVGVVRDELIGLLRSLDREENGPDRAFYLECWNGDNRFTFDRIGRGTVEIESAITSLIGSIQPGPLRDYFRDAVRGGKGDDGMLQRFQLAVWPDISAEWRNVDRWPDTKAKQVAWETYKTLDILTVEELGAEQDKHDADGIPFVRFTPAAQDRFDEWRGTLERRLRSNELTPYLEAHLAKYRSLIPSLALLTHLAERSAGGVGPSALDRAIRWAEYLETHARRIYGHAVQSDVAAAKLLLTKLRKGGLHDGFTARDVYRPQWSGLTERQAVEDALALLVDHGYLREHEHPNARKPVATYTINPKCLKAAPPRTDKADIDSSRPIIVSNVSDLPAPFLKHTAPETADEWGDVA